jgi:hypothetical protein
MRHYYSAPWVVALATGLCASAPASVVVQRFNIDSKMMLDTTVLMSIGTSAPDFTPIAANVGSAVYGSTLGSLESSDSFLRISSSMAPNSIYRGNSSGNGQYDLLAGTSVSVTWDWSHTADSGGWRIIANSTGSTIASLTFSQGQFTSVGGAFAQQASGNAVVAVGPAGSYRFEAFYFGRNNPTSSVVEFRFVPAPGAGVLAVSAAGVLGAGRRRRA